jgi:hypothetical protein
MVVRLEDMPMARVSIYGKPLSKAEVEALKKLVADAKCGDGPMAVVSAVEVSAPLAHDPVVLVVGTPATCSDPDLETNLARAHKAAQRVIWIWPQGSAPTELPPAVAKYAYSYVPWDAKKLAAVAADDDVTCFETATGEKVPPVPTERNLCVEEELAGGGKKKAAGK